MYKVIFEKQVEKFLKKHRGEKLIYNFEQSLLELIKNPYNNNLDIKIILGLPNSYRLRIGDYRFLYEIINDTISISFFKAGTRGDIYKNL